MIAIYISKNYKNRKQRYKRRQEHPEPPFGVDLTSKTATGVLQVQ